MTAPLLHLIPAADWDAARARGTLAPSGDGFVHLSTPAQVQLPADRLFAGRTDLLLLAVDPTGLDVRFEPGMPYDPPDMAFPHAYGTVPTSAVVAVLPYRPRSDGTFPPPPAPMTGGGTSPARSEGSPPPPRRSLAPAARDGPNVRPDPPVMQRGHQCR